MSGLVPLTDIFCNRVDVSFFPMSETFFSLHFLPFGIRIYKKIGVHPHLTRMCVRKSYLSFLTKVCKQAGITLYRV